MKGKCVSGILFFSLFTLVVCSSLKAMKKTASSTAISEKWKHGMQSVVAEVRTERKKRSIRLGALVEKAQKILEKRVKEENDLWDQLEQTVHRKSELQTPFQEAKKRNEKASTLYNENTAAVTQARAQLDRICNEGVGLKGKLKEAEDEVKNTTKAFNLAGQACETAEKRLKDSFGQDDEKIKTGGIGEFLKDHSSTRSPQKEGSWENRCLPYVGGSGIAWGFDSLCSYLRTTKRFKNSKKFRLLHQSVNDSKKSQVSSFFVSAWGGRVHSFVNKDSGEVYSLKDGLSIGAKNFGGETFNGFVLRCCWDGLATHYREKICDNGFVKFVRNKLPEQVQKFGCLCMLRAIWNFQKSKLPSLQ